MNSHANWTSLWVRHVKDHGPFIIGAFLLVLYSYPGWVLPGIPGTDDLSNLNVPQRQILGWFYRNGHWPLWNPFNFGGQPFLAAGQSGPLYFPNVLFALFPITTALKFSYIFHFLLLSFGMYCLTWFFTKHRWASLVATVVFADSGFLLGHQIHTQMFDAMCWLPLVFWLFLRLQQRFTKKRLAAFSLAFAGQVFAGHPQITFYTILFSLLYAGVMWCWHPTWYGIKQILWGLSGMVLGALIACAQLLPTLQLIGYSDRSQVSHAFLLRGSLPPIGLLQFLVPFSVGGGYTPHRFSIDQYSSLYHASNFWEFLPFVGVFFVCFAVATAVSSFIANRAVRTLSLIVAFSLCLALGSNTFFSVVLTDFPGFSLFRVPARYIGLTDLSIALLVGIGIAHLSQTQKSQWLRRFLPFVPIAALATLLLVYQFGPYAKMSKIGFWIPFVQLTVIFLLSLFQLNPGRRWPTPSLVVFGLVGLSFQTLSLSTFINWEPGAYASPNALTTYLERHMTGTYPFTRVASLGDTSMQMDRSASWGIPSVNGYDSLVPTWYVTKVNLTWSPATFLSEPRQFIDALGVKYLLTDSADKRSVTPGKLGQTSWMHWLPNLHGATALRIRMGQHNTMTDVFSPLFSVTLKNGQHELTEQVSGWPAHAYVIDLPANWPKNDATQAIIQSENWTGTYTIASLQVLGANPQTYPIHELFGPRTWQRVTTLGDVTVWKNPDTLYPAWVATPDNALSPITKSSVELKSWEPNQQQWQVNASQQGVFVISQTYDPSWSATIDGHPVQPERIGGLLTGLPISKGSHNVRLTYKPRSFQAGLGISLISLLFAILLLALPKKEEQHS